MAEAWQGYVNAVLYMTQFSRSLDDEREVERIAAYLAGHGVLNSTPHEVAGQLQSALTSGTGLTRDAIPQPHAEAEARRFIELVIARMRELL